MTSTPQPPGQDSLRWPSPEEAVALPVTDLAFRVLAALAGSSGAHFIHRDFVAQKVFAAGQPDGLPPHTRVVIHGPNDAMEHHREFTAALDEAWSWLVQHGLLAVTSRQVTVSASAYFVTRLGHAVATGRETI